MERIGLDANLLVALDVLLREQSVTRAAELMHTSPAAMSRTLARLRRVLGDPVLVRAGQRMVPTPRADALRPEVSELVRRAAALLAPGADVAPSALRATYTLQATDLVTAGLAPGLLDRIAAEAPGVSVRFRAEDLEATSALRDGRIDLELGVLDHLDTETLGEHLLDLDMMAAVRIGHPLARGRMTARRFAAASHVAVSRRGRFGGPADTALAEHGLQRRVVTVLPNFLSAMSLAAASDLVCLVPIGHSRGSTPLRRLATSIGLQLLRIPLPLPPAPIGMAWHPRHDADAGHRWLREAVRSVLRPDA